MDMDIWLSNAQYEELLNYKRANEIIINKRVDITLLLEVITYSKNGLKAYNSCRMYGSPLTKKDYKLLSEVVLKWKLGKF